MSVILFSWRHEGGDEHCKTSQVRRLGIERCDISLLNNFLKKLAILISYCLPAFIALVLTLPDYYSRVEFVSMKIMEHAIEVKTHKITEAHVVPNTELKLPKNEEILVKYLLRHKAQGSLDRLMSHVKQRMFRIWLEYSTVIAIMTILPFFMLGVRIAFRNKRKDVDDSDRWQSVSRDWGMKLFVACAIATGWTYTLNPTERASSTLLEYINTQDIFSDNTLPGFIFRADLPLVVAGFLGWYLHLTTYFISKLYYDDVFGTRIYRFLVGKLLFTYGVAMVISSVNAEQAGITIFLIGYFPLSALSVLKEFGVKAFQGGAQDKGALSMLPSISRYQILRLHEEGIDSISALAIHQNIDELKKYQSSITPLIELWVDCARLHCIVGEESYLKIKGSCSTASEFLLRYTTPEFQKNLLEEGGIKNPDEVARLLEQTFAMNKKLKK